MQDLGTWWHFPLDFAGYAESTRQAAGCWLLEHRVTPLDLVQWDAGRASWSLKVGSVVSLDVTPSDLVSLDASMASLEHRGRWHAFLRPASFAFPPFKTQVFSIRFCDTKSCQALSSSSESRFKTLA
eukprot:scaffold24350_cov19-Tisochrysis_lutea.AAC.1